MNGTVETKIWVNSADDHVYEPADLWRQSGMPERLLALAPYTRIEDDRQIYYLEGRQVFRTPLSFKEAMEPPGSKDLDLRMQDLDAQGIWASVAFPSTGIWIASMADREAQAACARAYNDWCHAEINRRPRLIGAAVLPLVDAQATIAETERVLNLGFKAIFFPTTLPAGVEYNQPVWEPIWSMCEEAGVPVCLHIGTGPQPLHFTTGAGGAIINYVETAIPAQRCITHLVASGVLDRHPKLNVMIAEGGSSWIPALVDRMVEAYRQHAMFVRPKLTRDIKEMVYGQVYCSFQHDASALPIMLATGYENVLFGCDYPHLEGTFPHTQQTLHGLFDAVPAAARRKVTLDNFDRIFNYRTPERLAA
ncbi:MAG: amidohydrolase family protein [Gammaproteobacteria bacterium]